MRDSLISAEHATALRRLMTDLDRLDGLASDPLTHAAARILLIHRWRRIVLRYPDLPPEVLPADLASLAPRTRVAAAYHHLTPGTEAWLDSAEGEIAAMPPADASLARRFRGA
jgi:phenylacetic acid degradation operon negative regulatory protein